MEFKRIAKFKFESNYYQLFQASDDKIAFLKVNADNTYSFPSMKEFSKLVRFFSENFDEKINEFNNGTHKKYRFKPFVKEKINGKYKLIVLTSALLMSILTGCSNADENVGTYSFDIENYDLSTNNTMVAITESDYVDESVIDNSDLYADTITKSVKLFNTKYFDELFERDNYNVEELLDIVDSNRNIPSEYKDYVKDFIEKMDSYYDGLEYRVFAENLKNLVFDIRKENDIIFIGGTEASYDETSNTMILKKNIDLVNDEKSKLIFRHELGHMFNNYTTKKDGYDIDYSFRKAGRGRYLGEALDVIFTTEPFLDEYSNELKENMGYSLTTNITRILAENIGYDIKDYISNNVYYFQDTMSIAMPDDIDSSVIEELVELQWMEYSSESIEIDTEEYNDLYKYITRLYIKNNITENMSYDEIKTYEENLIFKLELGIKDKKYVYENIITDEFNLYIKNNNIASNSLTK